MELWVRKKDDHFLANEQYLFPKISQLDLELSVSRSLKQGGWCPFPTLHPVVLRMKPLFQIHFGVQQKICIEKLFSVYVNPKDGTKFLFSRLSNLYSILEIIISTPRK